MRKWVARFKAEGLDGLRDRSSRPQRLFQPTDKNVVSSIITFRRRRWTGKRIAQETGVSTATVSRILRAHGLSRIKDVQPAAPIVRYERGRPGEMIHLDIKKFGRFERTRHRITGDRRGQSNSRGVGWEYAHVAIDDHSRIATSEIFKDETASSAIKALKQAVAFYKRLGITVERVRTGNGSCYKAHAFRKTCRELGIKHIRTKPYTPKTNGKAEQFIKTALNEWAYATAYHTSEQRAEDLPKWIHQYNWHRAHGGINYSKPIRRAPLDDNNLLIKHS